MKVGYISDVHMDMMPYISNHFLYNINCDVMVLNGDIGTFVQTIDAVTEAATDHPHITFIVVPGNHEYCCDGVSMDDIDHAFRRASEQILNLYVLVGGDAVVVDDVKFIGATLWSDLAGSYNPTIETACRMEASRTILEFRMADDGEFNIEKMNALYQRDKHGIEQELMNTPSDLKVVVVTHFSPSIDYRNEFFPLAPLAYYFTGNMESAIERFQPNIWLYGHTHDSSGPNQRGNTTIMSNQASTNQEVKIFDI